MTSGAPGRVCRIAVCSFALLYAVALLVFALGTFGLFGVERDPLSGIFLLPLGLPWAFAADPLPEAFRVWLLLAAPALNILILHRICKWRSAAASREDPAGG